MIALDTPTPAGLTRLPERLRRRITVTADHHWLWDRPPSPGQRLTVRAGSHTTSLLHFVWRWECGRLVRGARLLRHCAESRCINPHHHHQQAIDAAQRAALDTTQRAALVAVVERRRQQLGWSNAQLNRAVGIADSNWYRYRRGDELPRRRNQQRLATWLAQQEK